MFSLLTNTNSYYCGVTITISQNCISNRPSLTNYEIFCLLEPLLVNVSGVARGAPGHFPPPFFEVDNNSLRPFLHETSEF